jgi:hypothetical protein
MGSAAFVGSTEKTIPSVPAVLSRVMPLGVSVSAATGVFGLTTSGASGVPVKLTVAVASTPSVNPSLAT